MTGRRLVLLLLAVALAAPGAAVAQAFVRVPQDAPDLQTAIARVKNGGVVELAAGTYVAPSGGFRIQNAGKGFTIRAAAGVEVALDGGGARRILLVEDSAPGIGHLLRIERIDFRNGRSTAEAVGGAVTVRGAEVVFEGSDFEDNEVDATTGGGAALVTGGSDVRFVDCAFRDNRARNRGGALDVFASTVDVFRGEWIGNRTNHSGHTPNAVGGAISVIDGALAVRQSRFVANEAGLGGGAIYGIGVWRSPLARPATSILVNDTTFVRNVAQSDPCCEGPAPEGGGAIHVEDHTTLTVRNSRFFSNEANWGGAISNHRAIVDLAESVFRRNLARLDDDVLPAGGAVLVTSADAADASTEFGAINRRSGVLRVERTLFQGAFDGRKETAARGGCVAVLGDVNRYFGEGELEPLPEPPSATRAPVTLDEVVFFDCDVRRVGADAGLGGALMVDLGELVARDTLFLASDARGTGGSGGALALLGDSGATIERATFALDSAETRGGAILANGASPLTVRDSTFFRNDVSPGVAEPVQGSQGAAIFSIPSSSADPARVRDVTGVVAGSTFADHVGLPIVEGDFAPGPANRLRYDGNRFFETTHPDRVFRNSLAAPAGTSVAGLNTLVVVRPGGPSTVKSVLDNVRLTARPSTGALVAAPSRILEETPPGDPSPPRPGVLAYAWNGSTARLDSTRLVARVGLVESTTAGRHELRVDGAVADTATLARSAGPACDDDPSGLCLAGERFRVEVEWRDFVGRRGVGQVVPFGSADSGLFYFFDEDNWEMLVKVLDGCTITGHVWVFAAATTTVEYTLRVTDSVTGERVSYFNPLRNSSAAITDTAAFAVCPDAATATPAALVRARPGTAGVSPAPTAGVPPASASAVAASAVAPVETGCVATPTNLCLAGERFRVEVRWRDFAGRTGPGRVVPFGSADSGLFFFFEDDNWEMLVKVLDACNVNDRFWVFAAATTTVEYTLTVTDTETGATREYHNVLGAAAPAVTDAAAFDTCP